MEVLKFANFKSYVKLKNRYFGISIFLLFQISFAAKDE